MSYDRLIIAGSRTFDDYERLEKEVLELTRNLQDGPREIISGTAKGADQLGELFAKKHKIPISKFPADWELYGKKAGHMRNKEMAEYADCAIVFWNGKSRGTKNMIELSYLNNLKIKIIMFDDGSSSV